MADLRRIRVDYGDRPLDDGELGGDPLAALRVWLDEAIAVGGLEVPSAVRPAEPSAVRPAEPNAMVLATADAQGRPSARVVLLRGLDERGLVWFTNTRSRKGRELAANPLGALVFHWPDLHRQVRVEGSVAEVATAEADAYFASRPRDSQVASAASPQSQPVPDRAALEAMVAEVERASPGAVPRPEHWGGYRLRPDVVEFWQGRHARLHDRIRFRRSGDAGWVVERLAP